MIEVNNRRYKDPKDTILVLCMDGCGPDYITQAINSGYGKTFEKFMNEGFYSPANSIIPSYTNPNNVAIITGAPPSINGITGNYFYSRELNKAIMMNSPDFIRCRTILEKFSQNGFNVATITVKDKLRKLLSKGWKGINLSVEYIDQASIEEHGIDGIEEIVGKPKPELYSAESTYYALEIALKLLKNGGKRAPDLLYVTLTDYIPHKHAPGSDAANRYIGGLDRLIKKLDDLEIIIGITSDHGMNDKHKADGKPRAIWLETEMESRGIDAKIVLPIKDPYLVHHGDLGSCAWIYSRKKNREKILTALKNMGGIEKALLAAEASKLYQLPVDQIGDIFVLADSKTVIGTKEKNHPSVPSYLRSHGGLSEQKVPFILNTPLSEAYMKKAEEGLRNFDIFEYVLNGFD